MQHPIAYIISVIRSFFETNLHQKPLHIFPLMDAGSARKHFRVHTSKGTYIATYHENKEENALFFKWNQWLRQHQFPVPTILYMHQDTRFYVQEDAGADTLLSLLLKDGWNEQVQHYYELSLRYLARWQICAHRECPYEVWTGIPKTPDFSWVLNDLYYAKHYFIDRFPIPYSLAELTQDFMRARAFFENMIKENPAFEGYVYRDFQGRNILVDKDRGLSLIDYQGGCLGILGYDAVSLLYQARAQLSDDFREKALAFYWQAIREEGVDIAADKVRPLILHCILLRYMQVLGAYGNRGFIEGKAHFLQSIYFALNSFEEFYRKEAAFFTAYPALSQVIAQLLRKAKHHRSLRESQMTTQKEEKKLQVHIKSFSYKQGMPKDYTGNGGGFVWDMRCINNPGRYEMYKTWTGKDKIVVDFFDKDEAMQQYLNSVSALISPCIDNYLKRHFNHLQLAFGCTGGQHRSVYAAEKIAKILQEKYAQQITIHLTHTAFS